MPIEVTLVVLGGALLHAAWNVLVRAAADTLHDTVLIVCGAALLAAAGLPFLPLPAPASWPWLLASVVIHVAYFTTVASAYRHGELAFAYPLMRGTAPALVALATAAWLAEWPSVAGAAGIALVCLGVLGLARERGPGTSGRHALGFALGNAVIIAAYTLVDGVGARHSGAPFAYTGWLFLLTAPALLLVAWPRHAAALRRALRARWRRGLLGGACTLGAYALALWAMTRAPIALVAALRETSVVFALLLGAWLLRERVGWRRGLAALVVAGGAAAIHLG